MFLHVLTICFLLEFSFGTSEVEDYYSAPKSHCSGDSKEVGACVHRYIEKDFIAISAYIAGNKEIKADSHNVCLRRDETQEPSTSGGPEFEQNCDHLYEVVHCLQEELEKCDRISSYFLLRNLLYSLKKIMLWLCGVQRNDEGYLSTTDAVLNQMARARLLELLSSLECLECVRTNLTATECISPEVVIDPHLWTKILRLELGPIEVCPHLKKQVKCIQSRQLVIKNCHTKADKVYSNLTSLFVSTWCDANPLFYSSGFSIHHVNHESPIMFVCIIIIARLTYLFMPRRET